MDYKSLTRLATWGDAERAESAEMTGANVFIKEGKKDDQKAAWMGNFEDKVVSLDGKHRGKIDWNTATHLFNVGKDHKEAAEQYVKNRQNESVEMKSKPDKTAAEDNNKIKANKKDPMEKLDLKASIKNVTAGLQKGLDEAVVLDEVKGIADGDWHVIDSDTGKIHQTHSTHRKAKNQMDKLNDVHFNHPNTKAEHGLIHGKYEIMANETFKDAKNLKEGIRKIGPDVKDILNPNGLHHAKVYKDSDLGEYRVKLYNNGKHTGEAQDYFTDDHDDAQSTAKDMVRRGNMGKTGLKEGILAGFIKTQATKKAAELAKKIATTTGKTNKDAEKNGKDMVKTLSTESQEYSIVVVKRNHLIYEAFVVENPQIAPIVSRANAVARKGPGIGPEETRRRAEKVRAMNIAKPVAKSPVTVVKAKDSLDFTESIIYSTKAFNEATVIARAETFISDLQEAIADNNSLPAKVLNIMRGIGLGEAAYAAGRISRDPKFAVTQSSSGVDDKTAIVNFETKNKKDGIPAQGALVNVINPDPKAKQLTSLTHIKNLKAGQTVMNPKNGESFEIHDGHLMLIRKLIKS